MFFALCICLVDNLLSLTICLLVHLPFSVVQSKVNLFFLFFFWSCTQNGSSATLELDLEHYVVPAPSASGHHVYAANMTETPRSLTLSGVFTNSDGSTGSSYTFKDSGIPVDRSATKKVYLVIASFLLPRFNLV